MNELYINNNKIQTSEATSIKMVDENTYFTKSGKYTFDIEIPLKNSQNIRAIGPINRLDVTKTTTNMNARLMTDGHKIIDGTATVTQISDEKMKIQILSGNAEFNFLSKYQNVYIDEMDLGYARLKNGGVITEASFPWPIEPLMYETYDKLDCVFFPIHDTQNNVVNNDACWSILGGLGWPLERYFNDPGYNHNDLPVKRLAVQPYFCFVIKEIFSALGYKVAENQIENTPLKNAFIANAKRTLEISRTLPHWTVAQFIEEVEHFFGVVIKADDLSKEIRIIRRATYFEQEKVYLNDVCDEFEVDVDKERAEDISDANISYSFDSIDKYLRIDEDIMNVFEVKKFDTYSDLNNYYNGLGDADKKKYIYESGGQQYIDYREGDSRYLRKVNQFRNLVRDKNKDTIELKIIPVQMEIGESFAEKGIEQIQRGTPFNIVRMKASSDDYDGKPSDVQSLIEGNSQLKSDRDIIELAMNDGILHNVTWNASGIKITYPWGFVLPNDLILGEKNRGFSFELNKVSGVTTMADLVYDTTMEVNTQSELHVKFITNQLYSPMSLFIIRNKPYICKQIEYKITEKGIDPVKTGYFYEAT